MSEPLPETAAAEAGNPAAGAQATAGPENAPAPADAIHEKPQPLDGLLREFDEAQPPALTNRPSAEANAGEIDEAERLHGEEPVDWLSVARDLDEFRTAAEPILEEAYDRQVQEDIARAIDVLRVSANLPDIPAAVIEAALYRFAESDERFLSAWDGRADAPGALALQMNRASQAIAEQLGPVQARLDGAKARHDLEAAAAAVRNVAYLPPQFQRVGNREAMAMNDRDWKIYKQRLLDAL